MKKPYLLLILILLTSCSTTLPILERIEPFESLYGMDFSPYTKKGFLITPEKYNGEYESIGIITFTAKPGARYLKSGIKMNPDYVPGSGVSKTIQSYEWAVDTLNFDEILDKVYKICVDMGADALVNYRSESIADSYTNIKNPVTISGYMITGYAIKRKSINVQIVKPTEQTFNN